MKQHLSTCLFNWVEATKVHSYPLLLCLTNPALSSTFLISQKKNLNSLGPPLNPLKWVAGLLIAHPYLNSRVENVLIPKCIIDIYAHPHHLGEDTLQESSPYIGIILIPDYGYPLCFTWKVFYLLIRKKYARSMSASILARTLRHLYAIL